MLGKTRTLGKTLKAVGEDIKEDRDNVEDTWGQRGHRGRHSGTTGMLGKTLGDDGDIREGFNLLPEVPAAVGDDGDDGEDTR